MSLPLTYAELVLVIHFFLCYHQTSVADYLRQVTFSSVLGLVACGINERSLLSIERRWSTLPRTCNLSADACTDKTLLLMERLDDDGYEPDSAICLNSGFTNRRLTTYDDLYEPDSSAQPKSQAVSKRKSPQASWETEQYASAKRARHGYAQEAKENPQGLQEVEALQQSYSAGSEDLWQRRGGRLPIEIWQHVFTYLTPRQLGNLLSVNRLFHTLLHPSPRLKSFSAPIPPSKAGLPFLEAEAIWQISRRAFHQSLPAPLMGKSELEMWRLLLARSCQICGNTEATTANATEIVEFDPWHRGPGAKGVSPVFPFGTVTCGPCLVKKGVKVCTVYITLPKEASLMRYAHQEMDLILSSVPAALHPALPACFLTANMHIISPAILQRTSDFSTHEKPSRIYWPEHIEQVKTEFESVRALGSAAAEEWLKGLDARGKKALVDASRWEKWEMSGGPSRLRQTLLTESLTMASKVLPGPCQSSQGQPSISPSMAEQPSNTTTAPAASKTGDGDFRYHEHTYGTNFSAAMAPTTALRAIPGLNAQTVPKLDTSQVPSKPSTVTNDKAHSDLQKTQKRAEIERRASLLSPPISPQSLSLMVPFKDALQVSSPLDEKAWETLKSHLIAQRRRVEQKAQTAASTVTVQKEDHPKEVPDAMWDEAQGPLRARVVSYADDIISKQWSDGDRVARKTSSRFAVEMLLEIRKRFYADVAKDAEARRAAGKPPIVDPSQGPWTQKLTLENMKWIFDLKIRPLTEKHKKEPFLCSICTQMKWFGLEGVIQHYAAKHNSSLSRGNVVVFWRAEWPAQSPFSPDPARPGAAAATSEKIATGRGQQKQPRQVTASELDQQPTQALKAFANTATTPGLAPASDSISHGHGLHQPSEHYTQLFGIQGPVSYDTQAGLSPAAWHAPDQVVHTEQAPVVYRGKFTTQTTRKVWDTIAGASIPPSIKAAILVHHVVKKFQNEFGEDAPLDAFIVAAKRCQGSNPLPALKKIKCKLCEGKLGGSPNFPFLELLQHFKSHHMSGGKKAKAKLKPLGDWRTDMVQLPAMKDIERIPGVLKGSPAYELAADAMPWAFDRKEVPESLQPFANYTLPSRPSPAITHDAQLSSSQALAFEVEQPSVPSCETQKEPQQGFHITQSNSTVSAAPPPNAPTGLAATRSQVISPQRPPASALPPHEETDYSPEPYLEDHEAEGVYSPPPPEAYQTRGPDNAGPQANPFALSNLHVEVQDAKPKATVAAGTSGKQKKPSTYYHRVDQPNLRPAREVYKSSSQHRKGPTQQHTQPEGLPIGQHPAVTHGGYDTGRVDQSLAQNGSRYSTSSAQQQPVQGPHAHHKQEPTPYYPAFDPNRPPSGHRGRQPAQKPMAHYRGRSNSPSAISGMPTYPQYRERSPPRHYQEQLMPPPFEDYAPAEPMAYRRDVDYEIVRVRDPAGDYLLRRPIRPEVYGYDPREPTMPPPPPAAPSYPQPPYVEPYAHPSYPAYPPSRASVAPPYVQRATTMAPPQAYGPHAGYQEYNPHEAERLPPPPLQQLRRYGTETGLH